MGFHEHKIAAFTHKITDLPDQPTLSPQELKARFDSSPEELRKAHNAVCDEGERLSARVEGIVTDTFGDTIDREMLSHELAAELDAKAEQTALDAETAARESLAQTVAQKADVYAGSYIGTYSGFNQIPQDAETPMTYITSWQEITLGFRPKAVLIFGYDGTAVSIDRLNHNMRGGLMLDAIPLGYYGAVGGEITENGFRVCCTRYGNYENYAMLNVEKETYRYIAIR